MAENGIRQLPIDLARYAEQRRRVPDEALAPYAGQYVAFNGDASRIVAHGQDFEGLVANLQTAGIPFGEIVWEWVPGPDEETWL